jgi:succinoglycan biosynthesis protein ExoA
MPRVSVIVPCYNEERTIRLLLEALEAQNYDHRQMEVIIADGLSRDHTRREIAAFQVEHPDLVVNIITNPARSIPSGLNRAIEASKGEIILRLDAHSMPRPDYIANCVADLELGMGDSVGGVWEIRPGSPGLQARAIAIAAAHPLGVGDARYRFTETAQVVDTVPFGAFYRQIIDRIGPFNEELLTNEDYEFNARLRLSGGRIWLDPAIRSAYFARASLVELARQYWRYGYWKVRMLRRYPQTLRWRQALPPLLVASLLLLLLLAPWLPVAAWAFMIESITYILALLGVGFQTALRRRDWALIFGVPLAIATMHLAWGSAFLWSLISR